MTGADALKSPTIHELPFDDAAIRTWAQGDPRASNWPVVYALAGGSEVYVGETLNMAARARQHLASDERAHLERAHVVVDDTFHKSACLDLESYLIRLFSGDDARTVLNRNTGIVDADYYRRADYQERFDAIFNELHKRGLFTRSIPEIRNSDLFKLSPFKALTPDQAAATATIVEALFDDLELGEQSTSIVRGNPGTARRSSPYTWSSCSRTLRRRTGTRSRAVNPCSTTSSPRVTASSSVSFASD